VNTVLASIAAKAFKEFADAIEKGATPKSVAQKALKDSWKVSQALSNHAPKLPLGLHNPTALSVI
jgi:hypothetical protein